MGRVWFRRARSARFDIYDGVSLLLLAALLILALLTFRDYSISNDEGVQHRYAELIVAYYTSGFTDRALFGFDNLYLYGGLFDVAALLLSHVIPGDVYIIRHALCAVFGLGGLAATWATARLIAGPRAGLLALLSLAVCGTWFGTMFNHTKDIPFAAAMIGATYFLLRVARRAQSPRFRDLAAFGVLTGVALGQRALGMLLIAYVPIALAAHLPPRSSVGNAFRWLSRALFFFLPACALAYLIMIAAWPWAAISILNPIRGLLAFTHFDYPIRTLLSGQVYLMADVPRIYEVVYLAIKLPLVLLLGAAFALVAAAVDIVRADTRQRMRVSETAFVAATAIVPVLLHIAGHGPAFSGMRHFLFVVPPLAVLAGLGIDRAFDFLGGRQRVLGAAALAGLSACYVWAATVLVRLHPYEYLYFNQLVGGLAGADQRYDTDYWVNIMHEAVVDLDKTLQREAPSLSPYRVAVCSDGVQFTHDIARDKRLVLATGSEAADFFIAPTHMHCDSALEGRVIAKIERMGTVIGVVKDRRAVNVTDLARAP